MAKPAPSRVAAALDYLERLKNQTAEFGGGVVENLADRARSVGGLAYEALATDPNMGRMTTAEFSEAASRPTPRLDQAAQDLGTIGRAIVTQPIQTGKAIVQGEIDRAQEATTSPRAAGEYAGSFIDPMRIAAALRKTAPVLELDVYHGTPHRFPATEANPLGEFDASKIGTGEGAQAYGHGIYYAENPDVAKGYRKAMSGRTYENIESNEILDSDSLFRNARKSVQETTGLQEFSAGYVTSKVLTWMDEGNDVNDFLKKNVVSDELKPAFETAIQSLKNTRERSSLYKADLPDEMIDRMLEWDKPLSEQAPNIQKAVSRYIIEMEPHLPSNSRMKYLALNQRVRDADITGAELYKNAQELLGSQLPAALLKKQGIPGIKYLDEGSRGASGTGRWKIKPKDGAERIYDFKPNEDVLQLMGATAEPVGTRNFVVFPGEEKKVRILERK
jgi:hypothetical protein